MEPRRCPETPGRGLDRKDLRPSARTTTTTPLRRRAPADAERILLLCRSSSGAPTGTATFRVALVHAVQSIAAGIIHPAKGTPPDERACHIPIRHID